MLKPQYITSQKKCPAYFGWQDVLLMLIVSGLYAVLAFTNLGSMSSPQTVWAAAENNETIVFKLQTKTTYDVMVFEEINKNETNFLLQFSNDDISYSGDVISIAKEGNCFSWQHAAANKTEQFVKLTAPNAGLTFMEIGFVDKQGEAIEAVVVQGGMQASTLCDESYVVPEKPSYYNSTYFDEIYYARTAYELVSGIVPYENSHPPFGKLMMALSVRLFGMTPFAWRFAGTLVGVLMLPVMYVLALIVLNKRKWALFAMLLLAMDHLHFSQTRIATIDSFAVFFIMLMYACMFSYSKMNFYKDGWRTLVPLGLAGVFTGFAIASKWTGAYAALGLAVIFFITLNKRWKEKKQAKKCGDDDGEQTAKQFAKYAKGTVLACVVFFGLVPFCIYFASYVPQLQASGSLSISSFLSEQQLMFSYHSSSKLPHPYMSLWYEWPMNQRPIYYYTREVGEGFVSVINAFGNTVVWWGGALSVCVLTVYTVILRFGSEQKKLAQNENVRPFYVLIAFFAQFVPWIFIYRSTFIYHYFASMVFSIIALVYILHYLQQKSAKMANVVAVIFLVLTAAMFIIHLPFANAQVVSTEYANAVNFFAGYAGGFGWLRYSK